MHYDQKKGASHMLSDLGEDVKKIFLAGVGAIAVTAEKSRDLVEELVKKGQLTVEQGKVLNEELKHRGKDAFCREGTSAKPGRPGVTEILRSIETMNDEERAAVKAKLAEWECRDETGKGQAAGDSAAE